MSEAHTVTCISLHEYSFEVSTNITKLSNSDSLLSWTRFDVHNDT